MPPPRPGLRPPQQRRSRESLERVLKAGEKLLAKNGYEGFTIADVSREANLSVGSVYGRFDNKDALIHEIHSRLLERLSADAVEDVLSRADLLDFDEVVSQAVHGMADRMHRERSILRVFMLLAPVDAHIAKAASAASRGVSRAFTAAVLSHRDEITHRHPDRAADVAFRMVYDVLARRVMYGPRFESELTIPWNDLVDEVIYGAIAYLRYESR
jgi:AcrR family transcriptional regulator